MLTVLLASIVLTLAPVNLEALAFQGRNSVEGRVTTPDNKSLDSVRVFLLNDGYGQLAQTYTDGSGRFMFRGLGPGYYYIQVEPAGTGYERQSQRIEINALNLRGTGGAEVYRVDFLLKPEKSTKKAGSGVPSDASSVLFYQDVPPAAKEEFTNGINSLKKDGFEAAAVSLKHAIEIFPDYYDALELLGTEYANRNNNQSALPLLTHAVEVNKNGWFGFYTLGVTQLKLNQTDAGIEALRRAVNLNPKSIDASRLLGFQLAKRDETRTEAIKVLESATKLAGKHEPLEYLALASLYSKNKQYREAANSLESYLQVSPTSTQTESIKKKIQELRQKAASTQHD
jgi:tetratricopeptide (TPR) repeat protein